MQGLASHDPNETTQYFQDMKSHVRSFYLHDEFDSNYLNLAFDKKKVDERGLWIKRCKVCVFLLMHELLLMLRN